MATNERHQPAAMNGLPTEVAVVRRGEGLDWVALERHLRANLPELDGSFTPLQFPHGSANLTYLLRFGDTELVLRRPPFGVVAPGAHDMKREYRVLSKLWQIFDRAPRAFLFCDDHSVIGSDFVVMERRVGEVVRNDVPPSMTDHVGLGRRISFALVDAMADLHVLDPAEVDLGSLGRPDGFVERQVMGWHARWDLVRPEHGPAEMDTVPGRLAETLPKPVSVSFVHNDLKLDNCQFEPSDPDRVQSIFDWDMTTLGDPLIDVGTLLNYWPDPSDAPGEGRVSHEGLVRLGLPTRAEMVTRYSERTGLDTSAVWWYEAFALWKAGVVVQQLHRRWENGESTDPRMASIADGLPVLAASASRVLDEHTGS